MLIIAPFTYKRENQQMRVIIAADDDDDDDDDNWTLTVCLAPFYRLYI